MQNPTEAYKIIQREFYNFNPEKVCSHLDIYNINILLRTHFVPMLFVQAVFIELSRQNKDD